MGWVLAKGTATGEFVHLVHLYGFGCTHSRFKGEGKRPLRVEAEENLAWERPRERRRGHRRSRKP